MSEAIYGNWTTFITDKKGFFCTLEALFVLKIFKFLSWLFGHVDNRLH